MMRIITHTTLAETAKAIERPAQKANEEKVAAVVNILHLVKQQGDEAVLDYTQRFDGVTLTSLQLPVEKRDALATSIDNTLKVAIDIAYENIYTFHNKQISTPDIIETMPGIECWRKSVAIEKVGLYIPGGTAPLFSTLLMLAVPATIAGCTTKILCTPPQKDGSIHPAIAYTAQRCGITQIYLCGGAQAIAAMAYGTKTIPNVSKIFGPGNQYVTVAKQLIQSQGVAIDMPAGPSEVLVIADEDANPVFVAADLLAQAEHGADSQVVCVTTNHTQAQAIQQQVQAQLATLNRKDITALALQNSFIVVVDTIETAMQISNVYAPEHLILQTKDAAALAHNVINAGSVFIGAYTPESVGDYASGTNHVLPTSAYANAYSGVSLDSFVKKITFQQLNTQGIKNIGNTVTTMAFAEGLDAHAMAVIKRLETL
jgi:histidinol dehydrogenase